MNLKKVLRINYWLLGICLGVMLLGAIVESIPLLLAGVGVSFVMLFFTIKYWRCPHCGEYLGRDMAKYCRHCGKELEDLRD